MLRALAKFLRDESRLIGLMGNVQAVETRSRLQHAAGLAGQLSTTNSSDRIQVLQRIVVRINVYADRLEILVRTCAVWTSGSGPVPVADAPITLIEVPAELKRCGMAVRLVVRAPGEAVTRGPDPKLVALVAKAHDWFARLSSGR